MMRTGIHNFVTPPLLAGYLNPLFNQVAGILGTLPALPAIPALPNLPAVKYYLYATGGVRDVLAPAQQPILAQNVMDYFQVTRGIPNIAYNYQVITGTQEATFGWVAANRSLTRPFDAGYVEMGGATAQIAFPLRPANAVIAAQVVAQIGDPMVATVEAVGAQQLFLASYPLGAEGGYNAYITALVQQGANFGLTANVNGTMVCVHKYLYVMTLIFSQSQIFNDPSRPVGFNDEPAPNGLGIIRPRPTGPAVGQNWPNAQSNLAKTLHLVEQAITTAFPNVLDTRPLDNTLQNYDFIGASNFWWTLGAALNVKGALNLSTLRNRIKDSSRMTFADIQAMHPGATLAELDRYRKATFTARWTMQVLRSAFGLAVSDQPNVMGQEITFTPYNGGGPDRNRFSWTLGMAVLLASPALNDLEPLLIRAP